MEIQFKSTLQLKSFVVKVTTFSVFFVADAQL